MGFVVKKGFDIGLAGRPAPTIVDLPPSETAAVYPLELAEMKQRLLVAEGDRVRRGAVLMEDKANPAFKLRAPQGGRIASITRGHRRFVEQILVEVDPSAAPEPFTAYTPADTLTADRDAVLAQLTTTGLLALIRQRPFTRTADPAAHPKAILVNGMNTAPFQVDAELVAAAAPTALQAGLDLMTCLTDGPVHLCLGENAGATLKGMQRVAQHMFSGPHPAGNSSVHIARIDPLRINDVVWIVKAVDLVQIGRLFLDGTLPATRIVSLGGPGVRPAACGHYRICMGGNLAPLLQDTLTDDAVRVIDGDVLAGTAITPQHHLRFCQSSISVVPADRARHFLGWTTPGLWQRSFSRLFLSSWLPGRNDWPLGTNIHGEERAMVLTGHYDKVMPLNIMVDFLVRAVLAGDTDEAIALGILETDPEDFALCDVICPSKMNVQEIIRKGLRLIEEEGI